MVLRPILDMFYPWQENTSLVMEKFPSSFMKRLYEKEFEDDNTEDGNILWFCQSIQAFYKIISLGWCKECVELYLYFMLVIKII